MRFPPVDVERFPLVVCRYPPEFDEADVDAFADELEGVYKRGKLAVVVNVDGVTRVNAKLRIYIARRIDQLTLRYEGTVLAEAIVASSAFLRAGVTAYNLFKADRSYPSRCFKSQVEAVIWATRILERN